MIRDYIEGVYIGPIIIRILVYWFDRFNVFGRKTEMECIKKYGKRLFNKKIPGDELYGLLLDLRTTWPFVQFVLSMIIMLAVPFSNEARISLFLSVNIMLEIINIYKTVLSVSYLFNISVFTIYFLFFPTKAPMTVVLMITFLSVFVAWLIGKCCQLSGGFAVNKS